MLPAPLLFPPHISLWSFPYRPQSLSPVCPVHCRMSRSTPGFHPLDASSTLQAATTKSDSRHFQMSPGRQSAPVDPHCYGERHIPSCGSLPLSGTHREGEPTGMCGLRSIAPSSAQPQTWAQQLKPESMWGNLGGSKQK